MFLLVSGMGEKKDARRKVYLERKVSKNDISEMNIEIMPGFKLTWFYAGHAQKIEPRYKDYPYNKQFVRKRFYNNIHLIMNNFSKFKFFDNILSIAVVIVIS